MIIKKIYLENYRSHNEKTIEFSQGINLILGKNGSGKSSILEAISSTLLELLIGPEKLLEKNLLNMVLTLLKLKLSLLVLMAEFILLQISLIRKNLNKKF